MNLKGEGPQVIREVHHYFQVMWRMKAVAGAVALLALLLVLTVYWVGSAVFGVTTAISIEWGIDQDLVGSGVEVDGKPVGKLEKYGPATKTVFPVDPGKHTVRVVTGMFECPPHEVEVKRGERRHLLLDIEETSNAHGAPATRIVFR